MFQQPTDWLSLAVPLLLLPGCFLDFGLEVATASVGSDVPAARRWRISAITEDLPTRLTDTSG